MQSDTRPEPSAFTIQPVLPYEMSETGKTEVIYPDIYSGDKGISLKGTKVVCIKITQGTNYVNPEYQAMREEAIKQNAFYFYYHWLEAGNAKAQAHWYFKHGGSRACMVDAETNLATGKGPSIEDIHTFVVELRSLGGICWLDYLPEWYWEKLGKPSMESLVKLGMNLVSSNYTTLASDAGFKPYGGRTPAIWQFTDSAKFGGIERVDMNVFRGTVDQLEALVLTGKRDGTFWREWVSDGTMTLSQVAEQFKMHPASVLRATAVHYGHFDDAIYDNVNGLARGVVENIRAGGKLYLRH